MATLTSLLNLASNTLQADQSALNATANNVANQNSVGYTREVVSFQEVDSVTLGQQSYGQGVAVGAGATSVRDRVLEQRVQQQTQVQGQSGALETALKALEAIFGITSTSTSAASTTLGAAVDSFFNTFSSLEANPNDPSTRQAVLSAASKLTDAFNSASTQAQSTSSSLNSQVAETAGQVNTLTAKIAGLNQKILTTSPNGDAGALEDQRQTAIAQLSQLIGVDQATTEHNGITLTTSNGVALVSGGQSYALQTTIVAGVTHLLAGPSATDVTAGIIGGSLGGVLEARDQQVPAFAAQLDQLAYGIGTAVNTQNAAGLNGYGIAGGTIFTVPATAAGAAGSISVATSDPNAIAAAAAGQGLTGNGNAVALAGLANTATVTGQTASGFYASFLSQLGNAVSSATSNNTVEQASLTQLTSQRNSISGVSLDQEAANLTQYQRSYEAAAKIFSIVDTLLAAALNLGVATAVN